MSSGLTGLCGTDCARPSSLCTTESAAFESLPSQFVLRDLASTEHGRKMNWCCKLPFRLFSVAQARRSFVTCGIAGVLKSKIESFAKAREEVQAGRSTP
jgi:hypothetical protein